MDMEINKNEYENGSILVGSIYAKDFSDGYSFILFELTSVIIKVLVIITDVENLKVEDNIEIFIKNKEELKKLNTKIITCCSKFMTIAPNIQNISKDDFEDGLKSLYVAKKDFKNTMFWQYISYSVTDIKEGKTEFDIISQYHLLWTAFNSLYSKLYPGNDDKSSIEKYSHKSYVIEYFEEMIGDYSLYKLLKRLINGNLTLGKEKENVSDGLKESIEKNENKSISKYSLLCLYSIRNSIIHGSAVKLALKF